MLTHPNTRLLAPILVAAAVLTGCSRDHRPEPKPLHAATETGATNAVADPRTGQDWFVEQAEAAGLRFVHFNGMSGEFGAANKPLATSAKAAPGG